MTTQTTVEVHLEELGHHSWLKALANRRGGSPLVVRDVRRRVSRRRPVQGVIAWMAVIAIV
ncbi:MAG: hypothetical protein ABIR39_10145 [Nocardioides sp.]|uniref:hypothetical protein n=1 Tax=Nocardioides sp. TaxID=35761 RepID=UPI0032664F6C